LGAGKIVAAGVRWWRDVTCVHMFLAV